MIDLKYFKTLGNYQVYEKDNILIIHYNEEGSSLHELSIFYKNSSRAKLTWIHPVGGGGVDSMVGENLSKIYQEIKRETLGDLGIYFNPLLEEVDLEDEITPVGDIDSIDVD